MAALLEVADSVGKKNLVKIERYTTYVEKIVNDARDFGDKLDRPREGS